MESKIALIPAGKIEYTLQGQGPVILVCHGTSRDCRSEGMDRRVLEAGFSALVPSRPGYGRTPLNSGRTVEQAAAALVGLLDCLNIQQCRVLAISGGGPTGATLAAIYPDRVKALALAAAITRTYDRASEPNYASQKGFYGPLHNLVWGMLGLMSRLNPRQMARTTLSLFSLHDPDDALRQLSEEDIRTICRFYQGHSSRQGALNDLQHALDESLLPHIQAPTLVIHSREDKSVPFRHAEWSLGHIPRGELCESGVTGHFYFVGPDTERVNRRMAEWFG
ncbi:MAG: alpha/beta hydrolase [Kiritimatiellota bacterium]|nr:alpha/beta hydrolase [Kiritimatiellota bacterium]